MEENKQETLVKLYSLKEGLSLLSKIRTEKREQENIIREHEQEVEKLEAKQQELHNNMESYHSRYVVPLQNKIQKLEDDKAVYDEKLEKKERERKKNSTRIKVCVFLLIASFILSYLIYSNISSENVGFSVISILALSFLGIISAILLLAFSIDYASIKKKLSNPEALFGEYPGEELEKSNQELEKALKEDKVCRREYAEEIAKMQREIDAMRKETKNAKAQLPMFDERCEATHKELQEKFSDFIDESDWGYINSIILNYKTGRALDLRDALLQVDKERESNRLLNTLDNRCYDICSNIRRGFESLQDSIERQIPMLDRKFSDLSNQMATSSAMQIAALNENIRIQQEALNESNRTQQALIDKMNKSNGALEDDIHRMRELADKAYYNN